jgi:maleylacetate reductase
MLAVPGRFAFNSPAIRVVAGPGRLADLAAECGTGPKLVLVSHAIAEHALVRRAVETLGADCVGVVVVSPRPSPEWVAEVGAAYAAKHLTAAAAIGGGAAIDVAKGVACWSAFGDLRPRAGGSPIPRIVAVPSTSAAATVTGAVALYEGDRLVRIADPSLAPAVVILDPEVAMTAPPKLALGSGLMALAHGIETLFSTARDPYSSWLALGGIRLLGAALPKMLAEPLSLEARGQVQIGAFAGSLAIRSARGALQHAAAHTLLIRRGIPHATAHALLLPHTLRVRPEGIATQLAAVAQALGSVHHVDAWIADLVERGGLASRLGTLGIQRSELPDLAATIVADRGRMDFDPRQPTLADVTAMLEAAL